MLPSDSSFGMLPFDTLRICCGASSVAFAAYVSIRQHTSAYFSIRQHASAYVSIRQHTSAYVSMHQHTSACISMHQHTSAYVSICWSASSVAFAACISIRQHTSAYVSIRQHLLERLVGSLRCVLEARQCVFKDMCNTCA
jgi:hypothetical protein